MSVEKIVAGVNLAVEKATSATAHLRRAEAAAEKAGQALAQATQGSSVPEVTQALGLLAETVKAAADLGTLVTKVAGDMSAYAKSLGGDTGMAQDAGQSPGGAGSSGDPGKADDPVERLRRELPPAVTGGRGQKTHGRWFAPGKGATAVASGRDDRTDRVNEIAKAAGCPHIPLTAAADVELKVAAEMRDTGITDATVVINNVPCQGRASCDDLLGVVLPAGSTLTVYGAGGFKKVYRGGVKRW